MFVVGSYHPACVVNIVCKIFFFIIFDTLPLPNTSSPVDLLLTRIPKTGLDVNVTRYAGSEGSCPSEGISETQMFQSGNMYILQIQIIASASGSWLEPCP